MFSFLIMTETHGDVIQWMCNSVLCFTHLQLTGMRNSMIRWWTHVVFLLPAHSLLEFPWCIVLVSFSIISVSDHVLLCLQNWFYKQQEQDKISNLSAIRRFVRLLRWHSEPYLCSEHASGQEAGLCDPHHALPPGAPRPPGETPDQEAGWHLAQQDGKQSCGHFPPQNLSGCQPQPAGICQLFHISLCVTI